MSTTQVALMHRYGLLNGFGDIDLQERFGELLQKQCEALTQRLDTANDALTAIFDDGGLNKKGKSDRYEEVTNAAVAEIKRVSLAPRESVQRVLEDAKRAIPDRLPAPQLKRSRIVEPLLASDAFTDERIEIVL